MFYNFVFSNEIMKRCSSKVKKNELDPRQGQYIQTSKTKQNKHILKD